MRHQPYLLIFFLSFADVPSSQADPGAWYKAPEQARLSLAIVKIGVINRKGFLTPGKDLKKGLSTACKTGAVHAWVTHRLSPNEVLTAQAGAQLGKNLKLVLDPSCIREVELDIEPLPTLPDWLLEFTKAVKKSLEGYRLRFAIPALSSKPLPRNALSWSPEMAMRLLKVSDGVDLMLYDTGLEDPGLYCELVREALVFTSRTASEKFVVLGFPVYEDKTRLHVLNVENLQTINSCLLQTGETLARAALCRANTRISVYAGWTLDEKESQLLKVIESWRNRLCQTPAK